MGPRVAVVSPGAGLSESPGGPACPHLGRDTRCPAAVGVGWLGDTRLAGRLFPALAGWMHGRLPVNLLVSGPVPSPRYCLSQLKGPVVWLPQEECSGGGEKNQYLERVTDAREPTLHPAAPLSSVPSDCAPFQLPESLRLTPVTP